MTPRITPPTQIRINFNLLPEPHEDRMVRRIEEKAAVQVVSRALNAWQYSLPEEYFTTTEES